MDVLNDQEVNHVLETTEMLLDRIQPIYAKADERTQSDIKTVTHKNVFKRASKLQKLAKEAFSDEEARYKLSKKNLGEFYGDIIEMCERFASGEGTWYDPYDELYVCGFLSHVQMRMRWMHQHYVNDDDTDFIELILAGCGTL